MATNDDEFRRKTFKVTCGEKKACVCAILVSMLFVVVIVAAVVVVCFMDFPRKINLINKEKKKP